MQIKIKAPHKQLPGDYNKSFDLNLLRSIILGLDSLPIDIPTVGNSGGLNGPRDPLPQRLLLQIKPHNARKRPAQKRHGLLKYKPRSQIRREEIKQKHLEVEIDHLEGIFEDGILKRVDDGLDCLHSDYRLPPHLLQISNRRTRRRGRSARDGKESIGCPLLPEKEKKLFAQIEANTRTIKFRFKICWCLPSVEQSLSCRGEPSNGWIRP